MAGLGASHINKICSARKKQFTNKKKDLVLDDDEGVGKKRAGRKGVHPALTVGDRRVKTNQSM